MKLSSSALGLALLAIYASRATAVGVQPKQIKNLVTFGDSYTDIVNVGDGGVAWPVYAAGYAHVSLFPFARSGGTCSNNITYRPFPSVFESQLPQYFTQKDSGALKLDPKDTIYTLWIGTNDIGVHSLLTGSNSASIVDVTNCMVNWVRVLYASGARNFLFQNIVPLEKIPLYAPNSWQNRFWQTEPRNTTEWSVFMRELVLSGNALTKLMLEALASTLPGSHIGLFDSHGLFTDMFQRPALYLNGTVPFNVTGCVDTCVYEENGTKVTCSKVDGPARDSYLWYDELHPSEQADRIVAREVSTVIQGGNSRWATWLN